MQIGDIVECKGTLWVCARFEGGPRGQMVRLLRQEWSELRGHRYSQFRSLLVDPAGCTLVEHPVFKAGQTVLLSDGERGRVISDPGDGGAVVVQTSHRVPHARLKHLRDLHGNGYGSGYLENFAGGEQHASRADLILSNGLLKGE